MIRRQRKIDTPRISWPDKPAYALPALSLKIVKESVLD